MGTWWAPGQARLYTKGGGGGEGQKGGKEGEGGGEEEGKGGSSEPVMVTLACNPSTENNIHCLKLSSAVRHI